MDNQTMKNVLLMTANVGTLFENLDKLIDPWINEFTKSIESLRPDFIALHLQEVGGKNYRDTMQLIDPFFKKFLSDQTIRQFDRYLILIDSDFTDDVNFTSLCSIYLIHSSLRAADDVQIYDFKEKNFIDFTYRHLFTGNLNENRYIFKERYRKEFFNEGIWSRKGFIQTKWKIRNQQLDLINIHLFHDPSNLIALTRSPSNYSLCRKRALDYSLKKIRENHLSETTTERNGERNDDENKCFYSIFGDFNFRLDLKLLVDDFCNKDKTNFVETKNSNSNKLTRLVCRDSNKADIFTIEDKLFRWHRSSSIQDDRQLLMKFDNELANYVEEDVCELEKTFPPSYPFEEELNQADKYMESRCPAWCDRILLSKPLKELIEQNKQQPAIYDMIGQDICMGDHKPIYLSFKISIINNDNQTPVAAPFNSNGIIDNRLTLTYLDEPINVAFINNRLRDLNDAAADLHDNTFFQNFNLNKNIIIFPTYTHYKMNKIIIKQQHHHQQQQNNSCFDLDMFSLKDQPFLNQAIVDLIKKKNNDLSSNSNSNNNKRAVVVLDDLMGKIVDYIQHHHRSNKDFNNNNINSNDENNPAIFVNEAAANNVGARRLSLPFSLDDLIAELYALIDGNLFKLKHLIDCVSWLSSRTTTTTTREDEEDQDGVMKASSSTMMILAEIISFLKSPTVLNKIKSISKSKLNSARRRSSAAAAAESNEDSTTTKLLTNYCM